MSRRQLPEAPRGAAESEGLMTAPYGKPVTLDPAEIKIEEPEPTKLYELRTLEGCPKQTVNCGAAQATFTRFRGTPMMDPEGGLVGHVDAGNRQRLTDTQVQTIREWVKTRVVLRRGGGTGSIFLVNDSALRGHRDIEPLAKYLALIEIPESVQAMEKAPAVAMAG